MSIEVGAKLKGKVSGITNFGAFIDLGEVEDTFTVTVKTSDWIPDKSVVWNSN